MPYHLTEYLFYGFSPQIKLECEFRVPPIHCYQNARCVFSKLYKEQRRLDVICLNTLLPFFADFNARMKKLNESESSNKTPQKNDNADEALMDALETEAKASVNVALGFWGELLAKLTIQSAYVSALVRLRSTCTYANTIIYAWDVQPRLLTRYVGDVFQTIGLGRFRSWLGPDMNAKDICYFEGSPSNAFVALEDSALRYHVVGVAEVVFVGLKSMFKRFFRGDASERVHKSLCIAIVKHSGIAVARSLGSSTGHIVARVLNQALRGRWREKGIRSGAAEFYGEIVGGILFSCLMSKYFPILLDSTSNTQHSSTKMTTEA